MNNIIAIPMGDPAGIGPEITVKALNNKEIYDQCAPLVVGNKEVLENAMEVTGVTLDTNAITNPSEGKYAFGTIDVISLDNIDVSELKIGEVQKQAGAAAFEYIKTSINKAMDGEVTALATTPINKE